MQFFLKEYPFVFYNIYWNKRNGDKVLLHKLGSILDKEKRESLIKKSSALSFEFNINKNWIIEGLDHLIAFEKLQAERPIDLHEVDKWRIEFINWMSPYLWDADLQEVSYLDLSLLIAIFLKSDLKDELIEKFDAFPLELQRKNIINGSILVLFALVIGYDDTKFLHDIFTIGLFNEFQFCESIWSEYDKSILRKLKSDQYTELSQSELERVLGSYKKGLEKGASFIKPHLNLPLISRYLIWGYETLGGSGPLVGVQASELSDFEILFIVVNRYFGEREFEQMVSSDLIDLFQEKRDLVSQRLWKVVNSTFQMASANNTNFMTITGL